MFAVMIIAMWLFAAAAIYRIWVPSQSGKILNDPGVGPRFAFYDNYYGRRMQKRMIHLAKFVPGVFRRMEYVGQGHNRPDVDEAWDMVESGGCSGVAADEGRVIFIHPTPEWIPIAHPPRLKYRGISWWDIVCAHEVGHGLHFMIAYEIMCEIDDPAYFIKWAEDGYLGEYAKKNWMEAFAECFASLYFLPRKEWTWRERELYEIIKPYINEEYFDHRKRIFGF